jgi:hypothetical protein
MLTRVIASKDDTNIERVQQHMRTCLSMVLTAGCSRSHVLASDAWRAAVAAARVVPDSSAICCSSNHKGVLKLQGKWRCSSSAEMCNMEYQ